MLGIIFPEKNINIVEIFSNHPGKEIRPIGLLPLPNDGEKI